MNYEYDLYNKADHTARVEDLFLTRRQWLTKTGTGFGALALSCMLAEQEFAQASGGALSAGCVRIAGSESSKYTFDASPAVRLWTYLLLGRLRAEPTLRDARQRWRAFRRVLSHCGQVINQLHSLDASPAVRLRAY